MSTSNAIVRNGALAVWLLEGLLASPRGFRNWASILTALAIRQARKSPGEIVAVTRAGSRLRCPCDFRSCSPLWAVFALDVYGLRSLDTTSLRANGPLVVDVGGHIGSFAVGVCELIPEAQVRCFEPAASTYSYLVQNIRTNGLSERVEAVRCAVADHGGSATFYDDGRASRDNSLYPRSGSHAETVPVVAFDDVIRDVGRRVDLLKLDCEGAEYAIILNSQQDTWRLVDRAIVEYHPSNPPGRSWRDLVERLRGAGLAVVAHEPDPSRTPDLGLLYFARK